MINNQIQNIRLSKEDKLLLLCARTNLSEKNRYEIRSILKQGIDWNYFLKRSHQHRLTQLVYWQLNSFYELVPEEIIKQLKLIFNKNVHKNLLLWGELANILKLLKDNNITAISYKGPILSFCAYNNLALRVFNDIDLIVYPKDVLIVKKLLSVLGYKPELKINESIELKFIKYQNEYKFIKKNIILDLHWKFTTLFLPGCSNFNFLNKNLLREIKIDEKDLITIHPEYMFLILCIHNYSHQWLQLSFLVDLNEFIQHNDLDWSKIKKFAKKLQITKIVLINLFLLKEIFGHDINLKIIFPGLYYQKAEKMSLEIINVIFDEVIIKETKLVQKFINNVKYRDTFLIGILDCIKDAFIPTNFELEKIQLPASLFLFYHILRPFILLLRYKLI